MHKLLILRHAEAGHSFTGDDHARTLTARGEDQARDVGQHLLDSGLWPDMTLVSDAMRTRQTCIWIGAVLGERGVTPYPDRRLYLAGPRQICSIINETPETAETLLLIGHMPGVQKVSMDLASADSGEQAVLSMAEHWPPAGLAVFETEAPWAELDGRDAALVAFRAVAS